MEIPHSPKAQEMHHFISNSSKSWPLRGYTPLALLGIGSTGSVYLASKDATGLEVAVKLSALPDPGDIRRLLRIRNEAEILSRLESPHIVKVHAYVEGLSWTAIVMDVVKGASLRSIISAWGAVGQCSALTIMKQTLMALQTAHEAGLVHGDVKPENILVGEDGTCKVIDFGCSLPLNGDATLVGTAAYMAPELWDGSLITPKSDLYAVAAVLFEGLTGERPFPGPTVTELMVQHTFAEVQTGRIPDSMHRIVLRGLAKSARDRHDSARVFIGDIEAVGTHAYGPRWEHRGRRILGTRVAMTVSSQLV